MFFRFRKDKGAAGQGGSGAAEKLPGPKDVPPSVGRDLVVKMGQDPDWVWKLKCVMMPHKDNEKLFDFRVYSPSQARDAGVDVKDYRSLDGRDDLVLFMGWFNKKTNVSQVWSARDKGTPPPRAKAA